MNPSTLLGLLLASASPTLHAVNVITTQDILQPDPAGRARQAFDDGLPSLISPLECESGFAYEPIEIAWIGTDLIFPEDGCETLAKDEVYAGRIAEIQRAINDYNLAIVRRAQETGAFPVYPLYGSRAEATDEDREQARQLLKWVPGEIALEALELSLFSDHEGVPLRMLMVGELVIPGLAHELSARGWRKAPWPGPMLQAMHWYPGPGDQFLAGDVDGYRATALVSESSGLIVLAIALNLHIE